MQACVVREDKVNHTWFDPQCDENAIDTCSNESGGTFRERECPNAPGRVGREFCDNGQWSGGCDLADKACDTIRPVYVAHHKQMPNFCTKLEQQQQQQQPNLCDLSTRPMDTFVDSSCGARLRATLAQGYRCVDRSGTVYNTFCSSGVCGCVDKTKCCEASDYRDGQFSKVQLGICEIPSCQPPPQRQTPADDCELGKLYDTNKCADPLFAQRTVGKSCMADNGAALPAVCATSLECGCPAGKECCGPQTVASLLQSESGGNCMVPVCREPTTVTPDPASGTVAGSPTGATAGTGWAVSLESISLQKKAGLEQYTPTAVRFSLADGNSVSRDIALIRESRVWTAGPALLFHVAASNSANTIEFFVEVKIDQTLVKLGRCSVKLKQGTGLQPTCDFKLVKDNEFHITVDQGGATPSSPQPASGHA